MEASSAAFAFSALAHPQRLRAFRLLVQRGPSGLAAGEIAARLTVPPSSLSFHLRELELAGLVRRWRRGRNVFYAVHLEGIRHLLAFLTDDCCNGRPEICGDVARRALAAVENAP